MVDNHTTSSRGRHSWVAIFFDSLDSTLIASLPHPPNTSTTKGMHDHPLRAHDHPLRAHDHPIRAHDHPIRAHNHPIRAHGHPLRPLRAHDHPIRAHDHPIRAHGHPLRPLRAHDHPIRAHDHPSSKATCLIVLCLDSSPIIAWILLPSLLGFFSHHCLDSSPISAA